MKLLENLKLWLTSNASQKSNINNVSLNSFDDSFYWFLNQGGWQYLSAYQALLYYQKAAPLFTAIDMIGREVQSINPYLYDTQKGEFIKDHDILTLLKNPNTNVVYSEFIYKFLAFYILTGNNYLMATGAINTPPLELFIYYPQTVSITPGSDGFAQSYTVTSFSTTSFFNRIIDGSKYRYVDQTQGKEIYQTKFFSPVANYGSLYGMSYLTPIFHEVEQYLMASTHNLAMLSNGATPSLVLETESILTQDAYDRLSEQMQLFYAGAKNSGRTMVLDQGLKANKATMTNKDMDFYELKKEVKFTIYSALGIPIPKVSAENMTLANMETAKLDLYDNAVLPFVKTLFRELTSFLIPRFGDKAKNLIISYDESEIEALAPRRNEQIKLKKDTGCFTTNEIRAMYKMEPILNGDYLYRPANMLPVNVSNEELETMISLMHPQKGAIEPEKESKLPKEKEDSEEDKKRFITILKSQKDSFGNSFYSDNEIEKIVNE